MSEQRNSKAMTLILDEEDWKLLDEAAKKEKLPKSEILRRALRRYSAELDAQELPQPQPATAGA
jgi:predicted transcriptional regulator